MRFLNLLPLQTMKSILNNLFILGVSFIFNHTAKAQFVLVDSIEFGAKQQLYITHDERKGDPPFALKRGWIEGALPNDSINEVYVKNKYLINLPYASRPLYIDETKVILNQFIRGDSTIDEPGKYIDGYNIIAIYTIDDIGRLTFSDSIRIGMEDLALGNDFALQPKPIIITAPLAVEGGGCNSGYSVYDENLKLMGMVEPDLPTLCGISCRIFWGDNEINFIDQDAMIKNVFSWCKTDFKLKRVDCKRITIDSTFNAFTSFLINDNLYISGRKQIKDVNEFLVLVYSRDGVLLKCINTDGLLVRDMDNIGNEIMYFGSQPQRSEVIILDKYFKEKNFFKTSGYTSLLSNKILVYKNNKIFIYETK